MESEHASQAAPRRQRELECSHDADANQSLAGGEGRGAAGGGGTHRASARRDRRSQTPSPCPSARACSSTKRPSSRSQLAATTSSQKWSASGTCHSRSGTPGHTASVWISNQKGHWEGIHWTRTPSSRKHSGSCVRPRPEIRRAARQACNVRVAHARVARRTSAQPLRVEGGRGLDVASTRARRVGCQALRCDHPAQPAGSDPPLECPREDAYRPTL